MHTLIKTLLLFFIFQQSFLANANLSFDGFVDLYYAYDFNRPESKDRDYTTQPARHDEFNANLVFLGLTHQKDNLEARLSLQAGTYVQTNYANEGGEGDFSYRHIQDAYIRYHINEKSHLIAGIMPSHIGYETVLSIENYTYTRSLAADYTPYYQSGVGFIHQLSDTFGLEGYLLNGWQNIHKDDSNTALATALRYHKGKIRLNYTTFFGRYMQASRQFHDFNLEYLYNEQLSFKFLYNMGIQKQETPNKAHFYTFNLQSRYQFAQDQWFSIRIEKFRDQNRAHLLSVTGDEFDVHGGSVGYDYLLTQGSLLRAEYRYLKASYDIFHRQQDFANSNQTLSFSLAARFE